MEENIVKLIDLLIKGTQIELIEWKSTSSVDEYSVALKSATYVVSLFYTNNKPYYKFWLESEEVPIVLLDTSNEADGFTLADKLYMVARDSAEKRTSTVNASINELDELIKSSELPF